ncbi:MAG: MMPL family transporter [Fervidicoccaceae archaeon]
MRRAMLALLIAWLVVCAFLAFEALRLESRLVYTEEPFVPKEAESYVGLRVLRELGVTSGDYVLVVFSPNDLSTCREVEAEISRAAADYGVSVVGAARVYDIVLSEVESRLAEALRSAADSVEALERMGREASRAVDDASRILNTAYSAARLYLEFYERAEEAGSPDPASSARDSLLSLAPPELAPLVGVFHEKFVELSRALGREEAARAALIEAAGSISSELKELLSSFDFSNYTDRAAVIAYVYQRSGAASLGVSLEEFEVLTEDPTSGARSIVMSRLSQRLGACAERALDDVLAGADPREAASRSCGDLIERLAPFPNALPEEVRRKFLAGDYALAFAFFREKISVEEAWTLLSRLKTSLERVTEEAYATGSVALWAELAKNTASEVKRIDRATIALVVALLLALTASLAAPAIVLVTTGLAAVAALGLLSLLATKLDFYYLTRSTIFPLVFGITVDYSLFYLFRVAEERARGLSWDEAVAVAKSRVGRALLVGGVAVVLGFSAYALTPQPVIRSAGLALAIASAIGFLSSYTLLPSLLLLLGERWSFWPSRALKLPAARQGAVLRRAAAPLLGVSAPVAAASVALAALLVALYAATPPTANIYLAMPENSDVLKAGRTLHEFFPTESYSTIYVLLPSDSAERLSLLSAMEHVRGVEASAIDGWTLAVLRLDVDPLDDRLFELVPKLREAAKSLDSRALVTGYSALRIDLISLVTKSYWTFTVPIVMLFVLIYMIASMGSLLVPLSFLAMVLLSTFAGLLASAAIMAESMREASFVYTRSPLYWFTPIVAFGLMVTVGMDYSVFLAARAKENVSAGLEVDEATLLAVERTGAVVAACGVILAGAFSSLLLSDVPMLRQVGLSIMISVLLDTFAVKPLLMPALLKSLGKRAWWPGRGLVLGE